jgi:thiol-disulfide isomerase/thioredoxin
MFVKTICPFRLLLAGCLFLWSGKGLAQALDKLPPFRMALSNGRFFQASDIPPGRPVLLIYFAPDCDHCRTLMNAFFKQAADFRAAEVVMVSFKPLSELAAFERAYQTARYPNIQLFAPVL